MEWISGGPAVHFNADGAINRRAELKDKVGTIVIDGVESRLQQMSMKSSTAAEAYALFEEKGTGRNWAAVVLSKSILGKEMNYAVIPESSNPPYLKCSKTILRKLTPLEPGEDPGAEEWRRKCWEEIERKESPSSFKALPEGTQVLWTVGDGGVPFLPAGKKIRLIKTKVRSYWRWRDPETDMLYESDMVPERDYEVLSQ